MIEIRFHGRGGQGSVIGAEILADAVFREGKYVQAFPYFGVERRGAPVTAYTRIDSEPIRLRTNIYNPDTVVVLDPTLLSKVDITEGLPKSGTIVINTNLDPEDIGLGGYMVATVDATKIARANRLGSSTSPIVNTAILGAVSKVTSLVGIDSLLASIQSKVPAKKVENANAAQEAYNSVTGGI